MPKDKSEVKENGRPAFYAVLYNDFRRISLENGYALAVHGSMASDMDLLAVAWTDEAIPHQELVKLFVDEICMTIWKNHTLKHLNDYSKRPHGRVSYSIPIMGDWFIDLSIVPPNENKDHVQN